MPLINIQMMEGKSVEQKRALVSKITDVICQTVDVTPEKVRIIFSDIKFEDFGKAGILAIDYVNN